MDISHVVIPQSVAAWVGLICILLLWKAVGLWMGDMFRSRHLRRRIGNRDSDDAKAPNGMGLEWYDRLIDAMDRNASINQEVVKTLQQIITKQDVILENSRMSELQQSEILDLLRTSQTEGA